MGLLDNLLQKNGNKSSTEPEQAVIVHFEAGSPYQSRLFALEDRLEQVIASTGTGELDGNEIATDGSDGYLYMYGPDADALFTAVRPTLDAVDFMKGARVMLRYGPPEEGVEQVEIVLGA